MLWPRALGLPHGAGNEYKGPYAVDGKYKGFTLEREEGIREFLVAYYALNTSLQG